MKVARTAGEVRAIARGDVGLVPTMGALHEGHLSLFAAARAESELVVATIFVNPAQFDDAADLARYPHDEERDVRLAADAGVDVLFVPSQAEIYPPGFATWVDVEGQGAEGVARPGHFRGVATVCLKLFSIVRPSRAYFGQKDAQQAVLVRRLVRDLELGIVIRVLPTVRDVDGLALSSRNASLSPEERKRALALPRALAAARDASDPLAAARAALGLDGPAGANGFRPDYVEIVELGGARLLAAAARVGSTRLIDNILLEGDLP